MFEFVDGWYFWWSTCVRHDSHGVAHSSEHHVHGTHRMQTCDHCSNRSVKPVYKMFFVLFNGCLSMAKRWCDAIRILWDHGWLTPVFNLQWEAIYTLPLHFQHLRPQQYPLRARPVQQQVQRALLNGILYLCCDSFLHQQSNNPEVSITHASSTTLVTKCGRHGRYGN